jgi:uncharacterized membrane protein YdfJ with MMPL/SSD domain
MALLPIVVVGSFTAFGVALIPMTGVGRARAVLIDASVVRAPLVPATRRLPGRVTGWRRRRCGGCAPGSA